MPTRTPLVRIALNTERGRVTFELTQAKVRALEGTRETGRLSDVVPFATARSLARSKLVKQDGPRWLITATGARVRSRLADREPQRRG